MSFKELNGCNVLILSKGVDLPLNKLLDLEDCNFFFGNEKDSELDYILFKNLDYEKLLLAWEKYDIKLPFYDFENKCLKANENNQYLCVKTGNNKSLSFI